MAGKPDFLCVGAQKSATTWLAAALDRVPGVFLPTIKESHFFRETSATPFSWAGPLRRRNAQRRRMSYADRRDLNPEEQRLNDQLLHFCADDVDENWYRAIFDFARPGDVCGEVCTSYLGLTDLDIARVRRINPEIRVVLLVRDPVDRVWSHLRMQQRSEGGRINFERMFSAPGARDIYLEYTDYAGAIPRWSAGVGPDRLRVIVFDRVREDPAGVLSEVLDHIGIPHERVERYLVDPRNVGDPTPMPRACRVRLLELLGPQYAYLDSLFPEHVARWRRHHQKMLARAA